MVFKCLWLKRVHDEMALFGVAIFHGPKAWRHDSRHSDNLHKDIQHNNEKTQGSALKH
jgi:hypothetical protein